MTTTTRFLVRALRWFRSQGVIALRLLTDNGSPYRSRRFAWAVRRLGLSHTRTRPYRPQTNGKVERWMRTVLSECLYLEVFGSGEQRQLGLERFVIYYNDVRPHLGIGGRTPRQRLELKLQIVDSSDLGVVSLQAPVVGGAEHLFHDGVELQGAEHDRPFHCRPAQHMRVSGRSSPDA